MASSEDRNSKRSLDSALSCGRSSAQVSFGKILNGDSAPPSSSGTQPNLLHRDKESEGTNFAARNVEKRVLLDIDLNVAPPEDDGSESPEAENGANGLEILCPEAAAVASNVSEEKVGSGVERGMNSSGIGEVVDSENRNGVQAHWSKGETDEFAVVEEEAKRIKTANITADSDEEREEKERRKRRWNALLEVSENSSLDFEENLGNKEEKIEDRKREATGEVEIGDGGGGGELHTGKTPKITHHGSHEWINESEVAAAAVRSTRRRAVAMPNKYRDSVLVTEAEFRRQNKTDKSAAAVSSKRKSR